MRGAARPLGTLIADSINGFDDSFGEPYKTDIPKAKKLMAEAGYPDGFEVTLDCPNDRYVNDEKVCQAVASMLARIRSEERRVGKECVRTCRSRWSTDH